MKRNKSFNNLCIINLLSIFVALVLQGCVENLTFSSGPFADVSRIDAELVRGLSKKDDVKKALGEPNGSGNTLLPTQSTSREIWFYHGMITGAPRIEQTEDGAQKIGIDVQRQILLIFFKGEIFDGYIWALSAQPSESKEIK